MSEKKIRVRFAPSPTGPLHIGGVRTALYNYLFAKKNNGDFVLRIEDTDQTRFVPGAEEYIIESLKWCGIEPNEGVGFGDGEYKPYRQSERKPIYRQYAEQLVKNGFAYYAFDTPNDLEEARVRVEKAGGSFAYNAITRQGMKNSLVLSEDEVQRRISSGENYVIRIKIPRNEEIRLHDLIRGWVVVRSSQIDDKVLFKSDGMPTYHLANVVDDYLMKITHVIRGEEWLPSAPLHVLLYKYLGWENAMPQFAHLPLLLRPDGNGKLSKRDGDRLGFPVFPLNWKDPLTGEESIGYREKGYFPEAVINNLALLGWHPSGNKEIFSLKELTQEFSLERVSKHGAKFDPQKAKWINQQYLRTKSDDELARKFIPYIYENIKFHPNTINKNKSTNLIVRNNGDEKKTVRIFSNEIIAKDIEITTNLPEFNNLYQIIKNEITVSPYYIHRVKIITKEKEQMYNAIKVKTLYSESIYNPSDFLKVQPNVAEIETLNPFILHSETSLSFEINKGEEIQIHLFFEEMPIYKSAFSFDYVKKVCALLKEKACFIHEFWNLGSYFFIKPQNYDEEVVKKRWNEKTKEFIEELIKAYKEEVEENMFTAATAENIFKQVSEKLGIKTGEFMQLFRVCITGEGRGPALFEIAALLGKNEVVSRLEIFKKRIYPV